MKSAAGGLPFDIGYKIGSRFYTACQWYELNNGCASD
jgi:hypothetical protein